MPRRLIPQVLVACALAACGGAGFAAYQPVSEKTQLEADQLFTATQRTIEKLGYQPTELDHATHTVSTRKKEVGYSSVPRLSYKYSFTIETQGGVLSIQASCEQNSATSREKFSDCGEERPQRVLDEMEALRVAILEAAQRVPRGPTYDEPGDVEEDAPGGDPDAKGAKPDAKGGKPDAKGAKPDAKAGKGGAAAPAD